MVLSLWYSDSERISFLISKMRKGNKERKKITDIGSVNKEPKMRGMKMRIITPFAVHLEKIRNHLH